MLVDNSTTSHSGRTCAYAVNLASSLPFRFKAGGDGNRSANMASTVAIQHHHRSTTKTDHKPFKSRHASKSALKNQAKGKVEAFERGTRKTPHQQTMSKLDRRNQAKQRRLNHHARKEEEGSVFAGRDGAPRIIAIIPLCNDVDPSKIVESLNGSVEVETAPQVQAQPWRHEIPRFKQKVQYLTPQRNLFQCLDACRAADFVFFALSAHEEVDEQGERILRCIESQGVSTVMTGAFGLETIEPAKRRPDVLKSLKSFITHFFPTTEKVHDLSNRQDCSNVMRSLCTLIPKGIHWRDDRSWMLVEDYRVEGDVAVVTGVVRGRNLKADRLVHAGDLGDVQIEKIVAAPLAVSSKKVKPNATAAMEGIQEDQVLEEPSEDRDDLAELAPEEVAMNDAGAVSVAPSERKGVLLDDHHYFEEDERDQPVKPKRLPKGTSKYQSAWYLGEMSDSGSDMEDVDDDDEDEGDEGFLDSTGLGPADGHFDAEMREPTEYGGPSEYPQSEAFLDPAPEEEADQLAAYRKQRRDEAEEDLEFPDEIELHPNVLARERLARYRGLKSLRTSKWETEEDKPHEPEEWSRLLEIADYKSAKNRVLKEALVGGVKAGTRVSVYLRAPGHSEQDSRPFAIFSLLRHEHKRTAMNVSISLSSEYPAPLKSKEELILQCGPRRLVINPLFSQAGNTPNNVHKFDRYLHPGRTAVASFIGPLVWGSVPCLVFKAPTASKDGDAIEDLAQSMKEKSPSADLDFIATGTVLSPSTNRVIAKRINLTGHPYKIHKKLVTVRYMFFNAEDVAYFRALQLWTKRGRSGYIKEALGTHGYFKATFDGKINPLDSVAVSLYKRVWPRPARAWTHYSNIASEEVPQLMEVS